VRELARFESRVHFFIFIVVRRAVYYYCQEPNRTYAQTIEDIASHMAANDIPTRAIQLDSWWYFKSADGDGVLDWAPMPSVFPNGIKPVHDAVRMPFIAHNRYWAPKNVYAKQNGGMYDFIVESKLSIPIEERFWTDLFRNASLWGMRVYEQDWLFNEFDGLNATLQSATLGRQWLLQMGAGADNAGLEGIQYCMPNTRHILQSVEIPAVT